MILIPSVRAARRFLAPWISALFCTDCPRKSSQGALLPNTITELTRNESYCFLKDCSHQKSECEFLRHVFKDSFRCAKVNTRSANSVATACYIAVQASFT